MATDNVVANPGVGGSNFRMLNDGALVWPAGVTAYATTLADGANVLQVVTPAFGLPVAQSGTWNITNISGAISLPSGASTSALQTTGNASLANLDVALSTRLKPADTLAGVTTVAAVTAITNALPTGANIIGALTANQSVNLNQVAGAAPSATNPLTTRLTDGTGYLTSVVLGANRYSANMMLQNVQAAAVNSSTANLAAAAAFTGTTFTTLGVAAIQVTFFADQNCTIQVQQAQEDPGVNWNIIDSWTYTANSTGQDSSRTIQAVGASFRTVVTNNGASTTTALRLTSVATPTVEALPRNLTQLGSLRTALLEPIPAGTNLIGKFGIDQTTPGTTNAVTDTKLPASAASADALANPTVTQIGATNLLFNGSTWDRQRGMSGNLTTGDTGAKVATGNGATIANVGNKGVQINIVLGVVSGTTPTAVFKVQGSVDGGANWFDIPSATTASLVASVNVGITIYPGISVLAGAATTGTTATCSHALPRTWRIVWTIGGTTPSFAITSINYNYLPN